MKSDMTEIKTLLIQFLVQNQNFSPENMDSPKAQYPTNMVPDNKKTKTLEGGNYTKNGGMWTLKHEIISPEFYELLINI